jgi:FtsH-binding integral membrane protein
MAEENFSPEQSLLVIQSMIKKAKNQFSENGHLYLLWGWVIFIASVGQFILLSVLHYHNHYLVWFLPWLAVIYQTIYLAKRKKRIKVTTYTDLIAGFVWLTFFILMILFGFILGIQLGQASYKLISPVSLALYGMPTFLSGIILRFKPLIIGAIGCWLLSVGSLFAGYDYQLLFLSAAMIIAWIIPGYILRHNSQKQND